MRLVGYLRRLVAYYGLALHLLWSWRPGRRALARRAALGLLVGTASLAVAIWVLPGIQAHSPVAIASAVVVLALLNLLIRPVLLAVLAPFSPIILAVVTVLFQVAAFLLIGAAVPGITVNEPFSAFAGSWLYALVNVALTAVLASNDEDSYWGTLVRQVAVNRREAIRTDRPGLVIVQIDGLAHPILAHQLRAGRVPFLARWIREGTMHLDRWTALLPTQTSASQAGILHGNNGFIPAFRWWEKDRGRMMVSSRPDDAAEIVRRASDGGGLLGRDGASVGNLVSGDAARSYITMATIKDPLQGLGRSQTFFSFFASPYNYLHTLVLTGGEVLKELFQAARARRNDIQPTMDRGMPYPIARAATNVALRALSTSLVMEEMYRGTPVIYVNYTDYDEIAHHSGPERAETLDALDGLDRVVRSLVHVAEETPRPYRFVVLSDHGQSLGATFRQRYGRTLEAVVAELMGGSIDVEAATGLAERWGPLNAALSEAAQMGGTIGRLTRAATRGQVRDGAVDLGAGDTGAETAAVGVGVPTGAGELPELVVAASGNLALVYFPRLAGRATLEQMEAAWPGMVPTLARHEGIGILMVRTASRGTVALGAQGAHYLDDGRVEGRDPLAPYGEHAITSLRRLDAMDHCGDIVAISLLDEDTDEVAAFEELIGSHGGLGGAQSEPFLLHPADWVVDEPMIGAEAVYRQLRRWLEGVGIEIGRGPGASSPG